MSDGEIRDLLGAWALDAIDDAERVAVERAIASDPELAAEARALRETVARLGQADAVTPPAALRESVLDAIAVTPQAEGMRAGTVGDAGSGTSAGDHGGGPHDRPASGTASPESGTGDPTTNVVPIAPRRRRLRALAAAAALIVAVGLPSGLALSQYQRAQEAEQQIDQLAEVLNRPGAELVRAPIEGGGDAVAVLTDHEAVLIAHGVPELPDGDYQLWTVTDDDGAVSAGVLAWHDGQLEARVDRLPSQAALAVTAEPAGGSDQPSSDPLVVLARP